MKLRLTQPGFENYTAQMGVIFFEDGLSVGDVLPSDAVRMSAVMGCEWEDGTPSNVSQIYLDSMNTPAPMDEDRSVAQEGDQEVKPQVTGVSYTEKELADIADASGIAGLREIAEQFGIKGNSIRGLMDAILQAAGKAE